MKDTFTLASFVAIAVAMAPPKSSNIAIARHNGDLASMSYAPIPPASTDNYLVSTPTVVIPLPEPSDCLDAEPCSTVIVTVTSIRTIPVSHVPSSVTSDLGTITVPQESTPATETVESSIAAPEDTTTETTTNIETETSPTSDTPTDTPTDTATDIGESSFAPPDEPITVSVIDGSSIAVPEVPSPTASDEPTGTSVVGTGSFTAVPTLPEFTAAADAVRAPAVVAGLVGWAALVM